jgi:alpha-amylase
LSGRVSLALVIHNHQPVGNFGWVIEDVFEHAYSPMLHALERHPGIRLGLHYTGPLLQWLAANRPESLDQIRGLVNRGQVEIVGGAYYEPILVALPDRDRQGQLRRMRSEMGALFGKLPRGAWLAERVWEPSLAYDLAAAGYDWTVLDDNHLRAASIREDEMWTAFTTDDRGARLTVFGTEQGLRYRIPFKPVEDLISYLAGRRTDDGRFVGMMGDDGEKFGSWPGTFEYCWNTERWVDRCFEAIEANREWLSTVTPSEWLESRPPTRRVYFPTASYVEMTEWVLPPDETPVFTRLLERAREKELPEARFLRGGFWRNYMARYREINELHKQMLRVSDKVEAMPATGPGGPALKAQALDHLYQGQSNDCYWHGLFGGIYIPHMRMATLAQLIAAEDLADAAASAAAGASAGEDLADAAQAAEGGEPYGARLADTDLDAIDEVLVTARGQTVVVDLAEGAGISSWDLRASRVALASVLRRRPEAYHERLVESEKDAQEAATGTSEAQALADEGVVAGGHAAAADAPRTIHDLITTKESGLTAFLHYDRHERRSGLVHLLPGDGATGMAQLVHATYLELGDFVEGPFEPIMVEGDRLVVRRLGNLDFNGVARPLAVTKTFSFGGGRASPTLELEVSVENPGATALAFELAVEWNLNLLGGGHNPDAYYQSEPDEMGEPLTGPRTPHDVAGEVASAGWLAFGNDFEGVRVQARADPAACLTWYPVETVSNSEGGFERVYQGSSLLFRWPVSLTPGERRAFGVRFAATQTIDHSAAAAQTPSSK